MVIEATRIRRLKRLWWFSTVMFLLNMIAFATADRLYDLLAILAFVHGSGWGLFAGMTRTEIEMLESNRLELAKERRAS